MDASGPQATRAPLSESFYPPPYAAGIPNSTSAPSADSFASKSS